MAKKKDSNSKESKLTRNDILKNIMRDINKSYGSKAMKFAIDEKPKTRIPFGVNEIDSFTGGGTVRGNFCIIYGAESSGKSTLAYTQIAKSQSEGLTCAYFDLEHSFNPGRAEIFGINLDKLVLVEEIETAEQAMDILIKLCKEKVIDFAVIDSIQAMSPKGEQETKTGKLKSVEEDTIALLARKMSQFLKMSKDHVYKGKVGVLMIGQIRTGGIGSFVTTSTLTGGNALKHYSMMTLFMRRGQKADAPVEKYKHEFKDTEGKDHRITKERIIGFDTVIKVEKHKLDGCQPELSELHLPFYYASGFSKLESKEEDEDGQKEI
jgi:recombination protein RecA